MAGPNSKPSIVGYLFFFLEKASPRGNSSEPFSSPPMAPMDTEYKGTEMLGIAPSDIFFFFFFFF